MCSFGIPTALRKAKTGFISPQVFVAEQADDTLSTYPRIRPGNTEHFRRLALLATDLTFPANIGYTAESLGGLLTLRC